MAQEEILLIWSGETQLDSTTEVCRRLALLKVDRVNYYEIVPFVYWVLIVPERTPPCQVSKFLHFQTLLGHFFYLEARTSPSTALCLRHIARSECRSQFLAEDWHFCYSRIFKACGHLCHMPGYDEHDKYNLITALDLHYREKFSAGCNRNQRFWRHEIGTRCTEPELDPRSDLARMSSITLWTPVTLSHFIQATPDFFSRKRRAVRNWWKRQNSSDDKDDFVRALLLFAGVFASVVEGSTSSDDLYVNGVTWMLCIRGLKLVVKSNFGISPTSTNGLTPNRIGVDLTYWSQFPQVSRAFGASSDQHAFFE